MLSKKQIKEYITNGFIIVKDIISNIELERLKEEIVQIAKGKYPGKGFDVFSNKLTDEEILKQILAIHQPHYISPELNKFIKQKNISRILSKITGAHLPFWDGAVKCMQSMYFVKGPGMPGNNWHQDEYAIPTRDRSLTAAWIAIDNVTLKNGCLWVIPKSHQKGYLYPKHEHGEYDDYDYAESAFGFSELEKIPVPMSAGDVLFFNGYLLHKSEKNTTKTYRRALALHYMNSYSLLPWDSIDNGEPIALHDFRTVIQVAGKDPYKWKGYKKPPREILLRNCKSISSEDDKGIFYRKTDATDQQNNY